MAIFYIQILSGLKGKRHCCAFALFLFGEVLVYSYFNTLPDSRYEQYVTLTQVMYHSRFGFILIENLKAAAFLLVLGFVPVGIGVLFGTFVTVDSLVATAKWLIHSMELQNFLLGLLPHGVVECGALLMTIVSATILSESITALVYTSFRGCANMEKVRQGVLLTGKVVVGIIIPLIVSAAFIESYITEIVLGLIL